MKLSYSETASVDFETAAQAAVTFLAQRPRHKGQRIPVPAAAVADAIWPGHQMHAQGAGGAASRILKRLEHQGRVAWTTGAGTWGWVLTE